LTSALTVTVTVCVTPCIVSSPCTLVLVTFPAAGTRPKGTGDVRANVAVGHRATSMMRPSNWALRSPWSLITVASGTLKRAERRTVPSMTSEPETSDERPTAVSLWPSSTSCTRYPALEPVVTFQVPVSEVAWAVDGFVRVDLGSVSLGFGGPSMKWM